MVGEPAVVSGHPARTTGPRIRGNTLAATRQNFSAPATRIQTRVDHDTDGVLMSAMDHAEAARARDLIKDVRFVKVETSHDFHVDDPKLFVELLHDMLYKI